MRLGICVGGLLACWGQGAQAQETPTRRVDISINTTQTYEDNVLRRPEGFPDPRGLSRGDFRISPSLSVDVLQPLGRQTLTLIGGIGYDFHRNNRQLNRERINLQGNDDITIGADCLAQTGVNFVRQQSDLADFFTLTPGRIRNAEQTLGLKAGLRCTDTIGIKPGITFDRITVTNSAALREVSDYRSTTIGASLGYLSPAIGEISVYGSYRRGSYPKRAALVGSRVGDNIDVFSGGLRFRRDIGLRLKANLSAGYTVVKPSLTNTRGYSGASGSADITVLVSDRLQLLLGYSRQVQQSNRLDISYSIDDSYNANATYVLGRTIQLSGGATRTKRQLRDSPLLPPNRFGGSERSTTVFASARYRPPGPIGFSLSGQKSFRRSDNQFFNYNAASVSLGVNFNF